jgi:hypothetical protein
MNKEETLEQLRDIIKPYINSEEETLQDRIYIRFEYQFG